MFRFIGLILMILCGNIPSLEVVVEFAFPNVSFIAPSFKMKFNELIGIFEMGIS